MTAYAVLDQGDLNFELTVSGHLRQRANTRELIDSTERLIELYSHAMSWNLAI